MKTFIKSDYKEACKIAADIIVNKVKNNPSAILGLATGSTPIGIYANMVQAYKRKEISFAKVRTVNLDEYVGLGESDNQSYVSFMRRNLFDHIDVDLRNTYLPNGKSQNLEVECERYNELLQSMRQDIQLLGIGSNGHIAFNEPNTPFTSCTHVVNLTQNTIKDNARFFPCAADVPTQALTMGLSNIMNAKEIVIVVTGSNKAQAAYDAFKGSISESCPASILQQHPSVTLIMDNDAARLFSLRTVLHKHQ